MERFVQFLSETNREFCLEIPETKAKVSDDDLRQRIKHQLGIEAIKVCEATIDTQDDILREMKEACGVTIRQIARIRKCGRPQTYKR